jgi:hydroxymethylpyrimidine pyrophosphatase-like HAD family hydrolase
MKSPAQPSSAKVDSATRGSSDGAQATLIIFDLDGTLAESKAPLDLEMAGLLGELLIHRKVAVISGASFAQFQSQFLAHLDFQKKKNDSPADDPLSNLSVLPTDGSSFYKYDPTDARSAPAHGWISVYDYSLSLDEKSRVKDAVASVAGGMHFEKIYGAQLEDRDSQMTFSALGQQAPIEAKKDWDPDHKIREGMVAKLRPMLPDFEINIGGMTSIDFTKRGMDKEYGINRLVEYFSIPKSAIVYVGDAIFPGGNDYAAVTAGLPVHAVKNISETKDFIRGLLRGIMEARK